MLRRSIYSAIFFLLALAPASALAYQSPGRATGYVNDFAHVLEPSTVQSLDAQLQSLQDSTGDQVAVVIVDFLGGDTVENYAVKLFQEWGIGSKSHDNGLLILLATGDHQARFEVGYGLEGTLTDLQSGIIINRVMIPSLKTGDYDTAVKDAVRAVSDIITGSPDAGQYSDSSYGDRSSGGDFNVVGYFFFIVIILNVLARILGRTRSWWLGGVLGAVAGAIIGLFTGFVPVGLILIIVLTIAGLIFDYIVSKHPPGSGQGGGMGGFWPILFMGGRGGSSGGGFGGFGGGLSGGGGASGRW